VVRGTAPDLVVGHPPDDVGRSEGPYGTAYLSLLNGLLIASRALGFPDEGEIRAVLERE
jgi:hypothetical protein